jgi:serine/threonine-protein kinase RsbW
VVPPSEQDDRPARPEAARAVAAPVLEFVLGADWSAPSIARDRLRQWLDGHAWSPAQADELLLAASEAVSNSVEHGYAVPVEVYDHPGLVEVRAAVSADERGSRVIELTVRDRGTWRTPTGTPGARGHGMLIMRTCADDLLVDGTPTGTTVVLRSRPVPPVPGR